MFEMGGTKAFSLRRQFALTSLGVILGIAVGLGWMLSRMLTERMLQREGEVSMEFVRNLLATDRSADYFRNPDDADLQKRFLASMKHLSKMSEPMRANAYGSGGRVLWSTDPGLVGRHFGDNGELQAALRGELVIHSGSLAHPQRKEEHAGLAAGPAGYFVESYIPVQDPAGKGVLGVVELYKVPVRLNEEIRNAVLQLWIACAGSALVLFLALNSVVARADRIMRAQQAKLADSQALATAIDLTGAVAHNLRNPLASIRAAAEMMHAAPGRGSCEQRQDIIASVDRANRWITELVQISQVGRLPTQRVPLTPVWLDCLAELQPDMRRHDVRWRMQDDDAPAVLGHPAMLRQILLSVLANAIEAMPRGGSLAIAWKQQEQYLCLTVDDEGVGISEGTRVALFRPFFTTKMGGLGIGLVLARRALAQWGGRIDLQRRAERGSRVTMLLPLAACDGDQ